MSKLIILVLTLLTIGACVFAFDPNDKEPVGTELTGPGKRPYYISVEDVNGNYEGNFLRLKLLGDIDGLSVAGVSVWPDDPNYMVIDNAVPDPNLGSPDPNDPNNTLFGSFAVVRVWKPKVYEIGYWVFDSAGNSDCKWGYIDTKDRTHPNVIKFERKRR